jgi:hypothetical protein
VRLPAGADPRLVAGLAMSGVPTEQVDDAAERERRSVRTRRAALLEHATPAWRARLAELAGVRLEEHQEDVVCSTDVPEEVTDLLLARRYSGADLVVLPDPGHDEVTEAYVAAPPPGAVLHARGRTPEQVVAAGGVVYVGRPRSVR